MNLFVMIQVVILGTGDKRYEEAFRYYEHAYPGQVCACIKYDESLAHQIYAGADALLVPSLFEPCGLTQLIAMRYGTVPVVRETGGLKDTVAPYSDADGSGNGFTFSEYNAQHLLDTVKCCRSVYLEKPDRWNAIIKRDMDKDVSWEHSASMYLDLYRSLKG